MGVQVTIMPHVVRCASTGKDVAFDQFQIRLGQRVVGYTAKPACAPSLVVRDLPEECVKAIEAAVSKFWKSGEPSEAIVSQPIGTKPAEPTVPPADPAGSAELEASLEKENK